MPRPRLPSVVYCLGIVSFCTDVASEMIVPLLPAFLASLGGSHLLLGLLQGTSDLIVSVLKLGSGWLSDRQRRRQPWILGGYALSALLRPLFAIVATPLQAVAVRAADRIGKGLRSAPRDALIADTVDPGHRGRAFGVLRGLDHAGALIGALLAFGLLALGCGERTVFALAALPGAAGVAIIAIAVREPAVHHAAATVPQPTTTPSDTIRSMRAFLAVVMLSAFGAGVDLFLLVRASELGASPAQLPLLWALLHLVRATLAAPLGTMSDRLGRRKVIASGLGAQALVLGAFAFAHDLALIWPLFLLHGLHAAFTDGAERGYVADLTGAGRRGTSYGVYHAVQGLAAFAAPLLIGGLWDSRGATTALVVAATASALGLLVLLRFVANDRR